jgi:DMSO/TMAO reductase YedYZ molybdopterin-dependent catalytic subunit
MVEAQLELDARQLQYYKGSQKILTFHCFNYHIVDFEGRAWREIPILVEIKN